MGFIRNHYFHCWASALAFALLIAPSYYWRGVVAEESVTTSVTSTPNATIAPTPINCESLHYDCYSCVQNGCYWCPTDSLCFSTPEFVSPEPKRDLLYPNRIHSCRTEESFTQTTCTAPGNFYSDPMYSGQKWIFDMINVVPVWEKGYFGNGVRVRVNDQGIESNHPEFEGRIDFNASCPNGVEPTTGNHGMTIASLVGASGNNDNCGVGIAPQVTFSSCNIAFSRSREEMLTYNLDMMDISQNSWAYEGCGPLSPDQGNDNVRRDLQEEQEDLCPFIYKPFEGYALSPCSKCNFTEAILGDNCTSAITTHCEFYPLQEKDACLEFIDLILIKGNPFSQGQCHFGVLSEPAIEAFTRGVVEGRDGKGIIFVFAAGNEFKYGDNTNFQGYGSNTRMAIPVGALGKSGNVSAFSTPGASVFISAPGGDITQAYTTVIAATNGGECKDMGEGSSFATPVVSGVVALMLDANPELTWRDVQHILAITASQNNDPDDPTYAINGAGLGHSNRYGFGIVNANRAVEMSESWKNFGPERVLIQEGSGNIFLPDGDDGNSTQVSLAFSSAAPFINESVYLYLKLNHTSRGHLRITLTSPSGMISVMSPGKRPESQQTDWMKFTSVRHWGEDPTGDWIISLNDLIEGDVSECIDHYDWEFPYSENITVSCAVKYSRTIQQFCANGAINPNGTLAVQCNTGDEIACDLVERFENTKYKGLTGTEACCMCGGGFSPDELPDTLLEWKVVVYGHETSTEQGFFSGIGNDVELGKWGGRGREVDGDRFKEREKKEHLPNFKLNQNIRRG